MERKQRTSRAVKKVWISVTTLRLLEFWSPKNFHTNNSIKKKNVWINKIKQHSHSGTERLHWFYVDGSKADSGIEILCRFRNIAIENKNIRFNLGQGFERFIVNGTNGHTASVDFKRNSASGDCGNAFRKCVFVVRLTLSDTFLKTIPQLNSEKRIKLKAYLSTCPNDIFEIYFAY